MKVDSKYPKENLKTTRDWHLYWVYNDSEFQHAANELRDIVPGPERNNKQATLARDFGLLSIEVQMYLRDKDLAISYKHEGRLWQYMEDTGHFRISITKYTTLKDYKRIWDEVQIYKLNELKHSPTKIKTPVDTLLLYAIFRARRKGQTFSQIFRMYQEGELPNYQNRPRETYKSVESLSRYYRKNEPTGLLKKSLNRV